MKKVLIIGMALVLLGCAPADRHFWYPVNLSHATCNNFDVEIYFMTNSIGWRSWTYILEKDTKQEITLGQDCVFRTIRNLPEHKRNVQDHLTSEQIKYLIEGF